MLTGAILVVIEADVGPPLVPVLVHCDLDRAAFRHVARIRGAQRPRSSACEFHESAWPALRSGDGVIDQRSQLQPYRGLTERVAVFDQGGDSFPVLRIFEVHDVIAHLRISFRLLVAVQVVRLAARRK
jgi:hypothetical protein